MAIYPEFPIDGIAADTKIPTRTYKLDIENGRIADYVNDIDAVNQMIKKAILTPRFDCYAYDDQYGSEIIKLIRTETVTREYIESEIESLLDDTLMADSRIDSLSDISCSFDGDKADIAFTAHTAFGITNLKGVV